MNLLVRFLSSVPSWSRRRSFVVNLIFRLIIRLFLRLILRVVVSVVAVLEAWLSALEAKYIYRENDIALCVRLLVGLLLGSEFES